MLIYRFPHLEVVEKKGVFQKIDSFPKSGFIISKFTGNESYIFIEDNENSALYFSENKNPLSTKKDYFEAGEKLLHELKTTAVKKTVLSRILSQTFNEQKTISLFHLLEKEYPNAFVYCFSDPILGTWIGASPEVLLKKEKGIFKTTALASTKKVNDLSDWNEKEIEEHHFVEEFIEEKLKLSGLKSIKKTEVFESIAGPVKHLCSEFHFSANATSFEAILKSLHPTPAVCGFPQEKALQQIKRFEKHKREFYAGYIGELNKTKSSIFVNLRCCQITKNQIHLYLGGGYTADSTVLSEWEETENKSKTILDLIQKL